MCSSLSLPCKYIIAREYEYVNTFFKKILHNFGSRTLCNLSIDSERKMWYNIIMRKFGAQGTCARRQIKMSQYPNWLHSPTHFREHSVALLSRPNVHDLWRVRFRNFLTCGFYLGGLLISLTSFLCFNYITYWLICQ